MLAIQLWLKEYELNHDALYCITGKYNCGERVVLEYDVFDVIAHTHDVLLQLNAGKNKTYASINERYHSINRKKLIWVLIYLICGVGCWTFNRVDVINQVKVVDNTNGFYIFEIILASILVLIFWSLKKAWKVRLHLWYGLVNLVHQRFFDAGMVMSLSY